MPSPPVPTCRWRCQPQYHGQCRRARLQLQVQPLGRHTLRCTSVEQCALQDKNCWPSLVHAQSISAAPTNIWLEPVSYSYIQMYSHCKTGDRRHDMTNTDTWIRPHGLVSVMSSQPRYPRVFMTLCVCLSKVTLTIIGLASHCGTGR